MIPAICVVLYLIIAFVVLGFMHDDWDCPDTTAVMVVAAAVWPAILTVQLGAWLRRKFK